MTSQEIKNRIMELEVIIRKLDEANKVEEMLNAIDEQLELANLIQMEEI